jgi:hypothetical protein
VRGRVREFDKEINERFFGDEGEGAIMSYGRENMARSLWSQGKILAGTAWDDLWDGGTTDYRFQLKDMVIDQSRGNEYALDDVFSISWNVHARLKGMDTILTPERCQLIAQFAAQYAVDPVLVAAIILAEQRDQSDLENVTDLVGGVFGYNTSVGVGQVTVSTAREIFPERFAGKADWQVVYEMRKDEVSIEAVAKYLSILQGEGEATLGRKPTAAEIGSRYTSSSFTRLAGEFGWGHIVELIYYEIGLSDKFKPMDATALSAYAVAYQKGQLPNTVQPDFNGWLIIEEGILQNEIPPASPFYAYWEEKFAELNALDYDNLSLEEQQCALKWLAQFEEQVRMLREI